MKRRRVNSNLKYMKTFVIITAALAFMLTATASCGSDDPDGGLTQTVTGGEDGGRDSVDNVQDNQDMTTKIRIKAGGASFTATLDGNATARAFAERLPMTLGMSELNGNEKYYYLDESLPSDGSCPHTIHAGDIMLYGSDCVVLFYKTFTTSYSYTRIGWVDDAAGLEEALGGGDVTVDFSL